MENVKATVFDIQRFSVHDGPGIRTTVFLKGCPLNCIWCHNPESKSSRPEIMIYGKSCVGCGECLNACPDKLHKFEDKLHTVDRQACHGCGKCALTCVSGAITLSGKEMSAAEVLAEVLRDKSFYNNSGGGVTVSGGEPLMRADFCYALFTLAKGEGISTACETSGFGKWENLERLASVTDIFLFDYKETSPERHKEYTGVDNSLILDNLARLDSIGAKIVLRCPIIPGLNDRDDHFLGIAEIANKHRSIIRVELEPYHSLGKSKADAVGKSYPLADMKSVSKDEAKVWLAEISKYTDKEIKIS